MGYLTARVHGVLGDFSETWLQQGHWYYFSLDITLSVLDLLNKGTKTKEKQQEQTNKKQASMSFLSSFVWMGNNITFLQWLDEFWNGTVSKIPQGCDAVHTEKEEKGCVKTQFRRSFKTANKLNVLNGAL